MGAEWVRDEGQGEIVIIDDEAYDSYTTDTQLALNGICLFLTDSVIHGSQYVHAARKRMGLLAQEFQHEGRSLSVCLILPCQRPLVFRRVWSAK